MKKRRRLGAVLLPGEAGPRNSRLAEAPFEPWMDLATMATGSSRKPTLTPSPAGKVVAYDEFVDDQLRRVGTNIKLSDLARRLMWGSALAIGYLLLAVIVDHWLVDLGTWGRFLILGSLVAAAGWFFARVVAPEVFASVNPAYAAQIIERNEPSLRNSLINLVLLRPQRKVIREVVFREVEQQAANRLSNVEVDAAVDQTQLIRISLALLLSLCMFAGYTFLSPKSPFQSLARIFRPFSPIARPSRVTIRDVAPGNTSIYSETSLDVSAVVENLDEDEGAWLVYSTLDRQIVDQRLVMRPDRQGFRFSPGLGGVEGLAKDVEYRIEAGDAVAGPYRIRVTPAPRINVEQLILEYPPYTRLATETLQQQGEVSGVEGTRVTVVAQANQKMEEAWIEFDPASESPRKLPMSVDGEFAKASFVLTLADDRRNPRHRSYQVRFRASDGQENVLPIEYPIRVIPDLPPEIDILIPERVRVTVPINAKQMIEIRAVDPDFGLSSIKLQAVVGNRRILNQFLLDEEITGQQLVRYPFRPGQLGLKVGDVVIYRGLAVDNRHDPLTGDPAPNKTPTEKYAIHIVEPSEGSEGERAPQAGLSADDPDDGEQGDEGEEGGEGEEDGEGDKGDGEQGDGEQGSAEDGSGEGTGESAGEGSEDGQEGSEDGQAGAGEGQAGSGESENSEGMDSADGAGGETSDRGREENEQGSSEGEVGTDGTGAQRNEGGAPGDSQGNGDAGEAGDQSGETASDAGPDASGNESGGANQEQGGEPGGGETSGSDSTSGMEEGGPEGQDNQDQAAGDESGSGESGSEDSGGEQEQPVSSDGTEDGDAFDRILDHMKQQDGGEDGQSQPEEPNGGRQESGESDGASSGDPETDSSDSSGGGENTSDGVGEENAGEQGESMGEDNGTDRGESDGESGDSAETDPNRSDSGQPDSGETRDRNPSQEGSDGGSGDQEGRDSPAGEEGTEGAMDQASGEQGDGSSETGENTASSDPAGESSEASPQTRDGSGTDQESGDSSDQESGQEGNQAPDSDDRQSTEGNEQEGRPSEGQSGQQGTPDGTPTGESSHVPAGDGGAEPGGEDPNLEFARKATDLALDYLKDKEHEPDPELLDKLGWTPEQMQQFVSRWERLRQEAKQPGLEGSDGKRQLNQALRRLGLESGADRLRKSGDRVDRVTNIRDSGTRSQPPAEYAEQYKAYLKSVRDQEGR